jgi:hypothetical protein
MSGCNTGATWRSLGALYESPRLVAVVLAVRRSRTAAAQSHTSCWGLWLLRAGVAGAEPLRKPSSARPQLDDAAQDLEHRCDQLVDRAPTDGAAAALPGVGAARKSAWRLSAARHVSHGAVMFAVGPLGNRIAAEAKIRARRIAARPTAGVWGERDDLLGGAQAWVSEGGSLGVR